jgi:flagellar export protein FliJ
MEKLEDQRQKLIEAKKKVEMLKVLKHQEEEMYKKEEAKLAQKTNDEMVILTWGRNSDES